MSQYLQWFGEQTEAVKLGLLTLAGGFVAGLWTTIREWRKPVLGVATSHTTATAPRASDDPLLLLLAEVSAINASLAVMTAATKEGTEAVIGRTEGNMMILRQIEELCDKLDENTREMIIAREIRVNRTPS